MLFRDHLLTKLHKCWSNPSQIIYLSERDEEYVERYHDYRGI